jgi:hypothetical protein
MKAKVDLDIEVKKYFIIFFEQHFSITPIYKRIDKETASFEIVVDNNSELFIVKYASLFAQKSALQIRSTANPAFLEKVFNLLFDNEQINYKQRLLFILDSINDVNAKFKFFSQIDLDSTPFFSFKSSIDKKDNRLYYSLCTKRYFRMQVNSNLYNVTERSAHFLTGRFDLDLNVKNTQIEFRCQLTSSSLDEYAVDSVIMITVALDKFEKSVKRCKKQMISLILDECFADIVADHDISLKKLQAMSEEEIKPYADLVYMSRI